jgi:hypothetical protein
MSIKLVILVLSHYEDPYDKLEECIRETWAKRIPKNVKLFFYHGKKTVDLVSDCDHIIGDKIITNTNESIENIGYKTIRSFEKVFYNLDFEYLFRTNSSSYVDVERLLLYLNNKSKQNFYSGLIGLHNGNSFASGAGYFLSRDLVKLVIEHKNDWKHHLIDDLALSDLLRDLDVHPVDAPRMDIRSLPLTQDISNNYHFRCKSEKDRNLDIAIMRNLYKIFSKKINILMSGPLRPNPETVIQNILKLRNKFNNCNIVLSTWTSYRSGGSFDGHRDDEDPLIEISVEDIEKIRNVVDELIISDEPTNQEIALKIKARTKQQRTLPDSDLWSKLSTVNIYKMFYGIKKMVEFIDFKNLLYPDDIVIRCRTDLFTNLNLNIEELDLNYYYLINRIGSGVEFDDCFSISNFSNFKKVWYIVDDEIYQQYIEKSWNAEDVVKNRVLDNQLSYKYLEAKEYYIIRNDKIWGTDKSCWYKK